MSDSEPKAKSKSVTLMPDLWERVEKRASRPEYSGNRSLYIRELLLRDLDGSSPAGSNLSTPTIMVDLTQHACGDYAAEKMALAMEGRDQREELSEMLRGYLRKLTGGEASAQIPAHVVEMLRGALDQMPQPLPPELPRPQESQPTESKKRERR
jgi:hypothetical protein